MNVHLFLLAALAFFSMCAVMADDLLKAAVSLGAASVALTLLFYEMAAPWAAVFELSVCAGLITVLFVSSINLIRGEERFLAESRHRFAALPLFAFCFAAGLWLFGDHVSATLLPARDGASDPGVGAALWSLRRRDILGQICMFLAGVLAIAAFFGPAKPAEKAVGAPATGCDMAREREDA
ncbi:MAG: hypothetical protein WC728_11760 [Elusimicrobiota bacterium]